MQSRRSFRCRGAALTLALAGVVSAAAPASRAQEATDPAAEVRAARQLFEANLDAIRRRDREAYLATYLQSESLARSGTSGLQLGYAGHAAGAADGNWPDVFVARNLQLVALRPGVVFGSYRYRVAYGTDEHIGISERVFMQTPAGWRIAMTSAFDVPRGTPPPAMALRGATLITGTGAGPVPDAVVVVRDGRIECAGAEQHCAIPEGVEVVDVSGTWITPGIIDVHVHLWQSGWIESPPDTSETSSAGDTGEALRPVSTFSQAQLRADSGRTLRALLGSGVTAVFDVGGPAWTWSLRDTLGTNQPHVAAAGPVLSTWQTMPPHAALPVVFAAGDPVSAWESVRHLAAWESDGVSVRIRPAGGRVAHSLESLLGTVAVEARAADLPLLVHATTQQQAKQALAAGTHLLLHGVSDSELDDEFVRLALSQGTIYCPTLGLGRSYERLLDETLSGRATYTLDPHACADPDLVGAIRQALSQAQAARDTSKEVERLRAEVATRQRVARANLLRAHRAGIPIALGSESGSALVPRGAVYAELEAMQDAGLTPAQVLQSATRVGARVLGREAELGTLEAGKIADLLVLNADPMQDIRNLRAQRSIMRGGELREASEYARP